MSFRYPCLESIQSALLYDKYVEVDVNHLSFVLRSKSSQIDSVDPYRDDGLKYLLKQLQSECLSSGRFHHSDRIYFIRSPQSRDSVLISTRMTESLD
jgi:hypothetical protein